MPSQVQVRVYIDGRGPLYVFTAPLKGLGQNRLDLDAIMREYKLKAIYAFSLVKGRGNRLFFDPRNGLSRLAYSGNPNAIILLDGDPSDPFSVLLGKVLFGFFLIGGFALVTLSDLLPEWLAVFVDSRRSYFVVLTCFITMLYTQLVWRPMKKVSLLAASLCLPTPSLLELPNWWLQRSTGKKSLTDRSMQCAVQALKLL